MLINSQYSSTLAWSWQVQVMILTPLTSALGGKKAPSTVKNERKHKGLVGMSVYMHLIRRIVTPFKGIRQVWRNVRSLKQWGTSQRGEN